VKKTRRQHLVGAGVFAVALAVLVGFAIVSRGYAVDHVELNDSGIWVTNNADDVYGRVNLTAATLDAYLTPGAKIGDDLDIFQDGSSVVARDISNGLLIPVDPVAVANDVPGQVAVSPDAHVAMAAGAIAVLNPTTGQLRVARYAPGTIPALADVAASAPAQANLGASTLPPATAADVAVGVDGTVFAASTSGRAVLIPASGGPQVFTVAASQGIQTTLVGDSPVYLDVDAGVVHLPGGAQATLPAAQGAVLQAPGPAADVVFVATTTDLYAVPLSGGEPRSLGTGAAGAPAAPVVVAGRVYAAWAGDPGRIVSALASATGAAQSFPLDRDKALQQPVFRVNHDRVVLNDMATGRAYDMISQTSLDDWQIVHPPVDTTDQRKATRPTDSPPTAMPDQVGVRAGRTSVLHVLDNDTDPAGGILAITAVTAPTGDASTAISPDGQTVLYTAGADATPSTFSYTCSNGKASSQAQVSVTIDPDAVNSAPTQRPGYNALTYPVVSGGSVGLFVAQDWRDAQSDPVSVARASADGRPLAVTSDGQIHYTADQVSADTDVTIDYTVTDGHADGQAQGRVTVHVLAADASTGAVPQAQPDMATGQVGVPLTLYPLKNDIPGADPLDPSAQLMLLGAITAPTGLTVQTDPATGAVTATATAPGTYILGYTAGFGTAGFSQSQIRLDFTGQTDASPRTSPDQVVVRGTVSAMVDVLANDTDPHGEVLTVTGAQPGDASQLSAAVVDGRWVRVQALGALSVNPQIVHYTVSDGTSSPAQGEVIVTQLPAVTDDTLLLADDTATVRAGDTTMVDVLAGDASQSGAPLLLATHPDPSVPAGQLPVVLVGSPATSAGDPAQVGTAFVVSNQIRYVAPATVTAPTQVAVRYAAQTATGAPASATLTILVQPAPTATAPDTAPTPQAVEVRAVSGDSVTIPIPLYGVDPDGDSVTVTGITSAPHLGRVTAITPTSITYQSFPAADNTGTDEFGYQVQDRYGLVGQAQIRVGLTPPGPFPLSVPLDDTVTARPGAAVTVMPKSNDLIATGDDPQVVPLGTLPTGVALGKDGSTFTATAPAAGADPVHFSYILRGTGGDSTPAQVSVRSQDGYLNPPIVYDTTATVSGGVGEASPLVNAWDIDGPASAITLVAVGAGTIGADGAVTGIPLADHVQLVWYEARDGDGATSAGVIFVPASGGGAPQARVGVGQIQMSQDSTLAIQLSDYAFSPRGRDVHLTVSSSLSAAPAAGLSVQASSTTSLTLTSKAGYTGPASISLQVSDATGAADQQALTAFITIPVQIGPTTPVLRCPDTPVSVVQGGAPVQLDIAALCHVWTPDGATSTALSYTAAWTKPLAQVSATNGRQVSLVAAGSARPGATGVLSIGVQDAATAPQQLLVTVVAAGPPRLSVPNLSGVAQGRTVTQTVSMWSPLRDAAVTVTRVVQTGGPACAIGTPHGAQFTLTPSSATAGTMTFTVTASDLAGSAGAARAVRATFTMTVYARPDPPSPPTAGPALHTNAVTLTYAPGAANGAPIDAYQVRASTGQYQTDCGQMTTCDVTGIPAGPAIRFQARAHNAAGWSDWSAAGPAVTTAQVPGIATAFTVSGIGDTTLSLTWKPAPANGSPVTGYRLSWTSGDATGALDLSGSATGATVSGLDNNALTTLRLVARNAAGASPLAATAQGQSSGRPQGLSKPTIQPQSLGDAGQVAISWSPADPNGPGPVTYQVTRTGGTGGTLVLAPTTATSIADAMTFDGATYTYQVTATNASGGAAHTSAPQSATYKALAPPAAWAADAATLTPTGQDQTLAVGFTYPASHGDAASVQISWTSSGGVTGTQTITGLSPSGGTYPGAGQTGFTITGVPNGQTVTATFQICNEVSCNTATTSATATPFGPLGKPAILITHLGTGTISASATADANGAPATLALTANTGTFSPSSVSGSASLATTLTVTTPAQPTTVTFTATLTSSSTSPARASTSATGTGTTAAAPPEDFADDAVSLQSNETIGGLQVTVTYPACNASSCVLHLIWTGTYPADAPTSITADPNGGTYAAALNGFSAHSQWAGLSVQLCQNTAQQTACNTATDQIAARPQFDPASPSIAPSSPPPTSPPTSSASATTTPPSITTLTLTEVPKYYAILVNTISVSCEGVCTISIWSSMADLLWFDGSATAQVNGSRTITCQGASCQNITQLVVGSSVHSPTDGWNVPLTVQVCDAQNNCSSRNVTAQTSAGTGGPRTPDAFAANAITANSAQNYTVAFGRCNDVLCTIQASFTDASGASTSAGQAVAVTPLGGSVPITLSQPIPAGDALTVQLCNSVNMCSSTTYTP